MGFTLRSTIGLTLALATGQQTWWANNPQSSHSSRVFPRDVCMSESRTTRCKSSIDYSRKVLRELRLPWILGDGRQPYCLPTGLGLFLLTNYTLQRLSIESDNWSVTYMDGLRRVPPLESGFYNRQSKHGMSLIPWNTIRNCEAPLQKSNMTCCMYARYLQMYEIRIQIILYITCIFIGERYIQLYSVKSPDNMVCK